MNDRLLKTESWLMFSSHKRIAILRFQKSFGFNVAKFQRKKISLRIIQNVLHRFSLLTDEMTVNRTSGSALRPRGHNPGWREATARYRHAGSCAPAGMSPAFPRRFYPRS